MAQIYKFFNSGVGDPRTYQASDFADYFGSVLSTGLLHSDKVPGMEVSVESGTLNTIVSPGKAIMKGHLYENTTPLILTHSIPEPTLDRIDRVVLRLDLRNAERNILLNVKEGSPAGIPEAPTLQRDNFIHEVSLAQILVRANTVQLLQDDLIDERLNEDLCGLVYSLISIPTEQFQQQWDDFMAGIIDDGFATVESVQQVQTNLDEHKANLSSQDTGKGASLIGVHDTDNLFTATNVEGVLKEVFTLGNSRKEELVDALLLLDPSLPITHSSSWEEILTATGQVTTGKKWASGTTQLSGGALPFMPSGGGSQNYHYIEVSELDFKPGYILAIHEGGSATITFDDRLSSTIDLVMGPPRTTDVNSGRLIRARASSGYVDLGGFRIPTTLTNTSFVFNWIAFEE